MWKIFNKKRIKRVLFFVGVFIFQALITNQIVAAITVPEEIKGSPIDPSAPAILVQSAFQWFVIIAGALSVAGLVYGGIMYATAGGSEDRINKAKTIVLWSLVGGVIILLAWGLVNFIVTRLSTDEGIPTPSI